MVRKCINAVIIEIIERIIVVFLFDPIIKYRIGMIKDIAKIIILVLNKAIKSSC